jgi:hypothetical protein
MTASSAGLATIAQPRFTEQRGLLGLRERYRHDLGLFSAWERTHLLILRWLYLTDWLPS